MAAWDRWFWSDDDSCYFYGGPHHEAYCPNFNGSSWTGPSKYDLDNSRKSEYSKTDIMEPLPQCLQGISREIYWEDISQCVEQTQ